MLYITTTNKIPPIISSMYSIVLFPFCYLYSKKSLSNTMPTTAMMKASTHIPPPTRRSASSPASARRKRTRSVRTEAISITKLFIVLFPFCDRGIIADFLTYCKLFLLLFEFYLSIRSNFPSLIRFSSHASLIASSKPSSSLSSMAITMLAIFSQTSM